MSTNTNTNTSDPEYSNPQLNTCRMKSKKKSRKELN